ncbi:alpha/beta fold hydrolase [Dactylosporangium sp. NPDC005572]|uniref:alpha/beta hydrolase n=1 Tax=Dactylosporangium sp. NPDC005572 TaxID=3156889 RepID=UPI0033BEFA58
MREEKVSFFSGPGHQLRGVWYTPPGDVRHPAVLLCLGYRPVLGMFAPRYAAELVSRGYAVLTFEYRGFGDSDGPHWRFVPAEHLEDIRNAVTYLTTRPDVDPERIAIWGDGSYGGAHAIVATALDQRVRCAVAASPFADGEALLRSTRTTWEWAEFLQQVADDRRKRVTTGESMRVPPEQIMHFEPTAAARAAAYAQGHPALAELMYPLAETADELMRYKPYEYVGRISPRAVLILGADRDLTIPVEQFHQLYEHACSPKKLVLLKNAGHNDVHNRLLPEAIGYGVEWFDRYLTVPRAGDLQIEA